MIKKNTVGAVKRHIQPGRLPSLTLPCFPLRLAVYRSIRLLAGTLPARRLAFVSFAGGVKK